jgi:hypothetical protein
MFRAAVRNQKGQRRQGIDNSLINWVIDFLVQDMQRVKLGHVLSDLEFVNGGVPQGTILGPLLFLTMVNDLAVTHNNRWKYVDDTSLSETIIKGKQSHLQTVIDDIEKWCTENDMVLNHAKCKELVISFAQTQQLTLLDCVVITRRRIPALSFMLYTTTGMLRTLSFQPMTQICYCCCWPIDFG